MLEDRVIIVTGGAVGIGAEYARGMAKQGANVLIADVDEVHAQQVVQEIAATGAQAHAVRTDVTDLISTQRMAEAAVQRFGRIDAIVNNAGMYQRPAVTRGPIEDLSVEEWDRVFAVNAKGVFLCSRAVIPQMKSQGGGKIVNISSSTVQMGTPGFAHYVATKGAVVGFTRSLARELGPFNINVNSIAPGLTLSIEDADEAMRGRHQQVSQSRSLKRIQMPADLVGAAIFLCSSLSDFITGQNLVVDGGAAMQ